MKIENFINLVNDLANEELYNKLDGVNAKYYFTHGGCYEFVKIIKHYFPEIKIMINNEYDHCAFLYKKNIYDTNGIVENKNSFKLANDIDILYMENRFGIPELKSENIDKILINSIQKCNIYKKNKKN